MTVLRQIQSHEFFFDEDGYDCKFFRYFTHNSDEGLTDLNDWYNHDYVNLYNKIIGEDGNEYNSLRTLIEETAKKNYVLLGNLSNGGDPYIDILCNQYVIYFRNDDTQLKGAVMIDQETKI